MHQFCHLYAKSSVKPPPPPNPRCFRGSFNLPLSTPVYCECPVTFLNKGQCPHTEQRREQEAELVLRSLYGSTHPWGDIVHCHERLKLATSLQDGCLSAPSVSSAAYIRTLILAEFALPLLCAHAYLHIA